MLLGKKSFSAFEIAKFFFLLGIFLKQFYISASGGFQIGDLCFMVGVLIVFVFCKHLKITISKDDMLLLYFVLCVAAINLLYTAIYGNNYPGEFRFYRSIMYYAYNFLIILTFRLFIEDREFLKKMAVVLKISLSIQLLVLMAGFGRHVYSRYMGTFNDPNQCGFFIFSSFLLIFVISRILGEGRIYPWFFVAAYIVMKTQSAGMLLGMAVLLLGYIYISIPAERSKMKMVFIVVATLVFLLTVLLFSGVVALPSWITNTPIYRRALSKLWSFGIGTRAVSSGGLRNLFVNRCWDRLLVYPEKILYGAGEGYHSRFPSAKYWGNEIHSSFLGPLFYYGIIPCSLWFGWLKKQLKGIKPILWCAYLALFIESLTLVNNRQPFFWMIFMLAGCSLAKKTDMRAASSSGGEGFAGGETVEAEYS